MFDKNAPIVFVIIALFLFFFYIVGVMPDKVTTKYYNLAVEYCAPNGGIEYIDVDALGNRPDVVCIDGAEFSDINEEDLKRIQELRSKGLENPQKNVDATPVVD